MLFAALVQLGIGYALSESQVDFATIIAFGVWAALTAGLALIVVGTLPMIVLVLVKLSKRSSS